MEEDIIERLFVSLAKEFDPRETLCAVAGFTTVGLSRSMRPCVRLPETTEPQHRLLLTDWSKLCP